jgi:2-dehydro-3-deoxygalactonokinase
VIGEELKSQHLQKGQQVVIMASDPLASRYELALASLGVTALRVGSSATWCGLRAIADTLVSK